MKQGWEIKKLGEICDVVGGSTPKTSEETYWGGEHYWISPAELDGSKYVYATSRTITDEGVKSAHLQMLPIGTVLLSSRAPIGKVAITKVPMYCNQGFKNLICKNEVINEYVYWFLLNSTDYLNSLGTGATFKEISKKVVEQIQIPVPPLSEQEKIVAELDCLSGIIEKKKHQLKEYDALAQSIFYEMFGNPIDNEKGWEVKKLGEVCKTTSGGTPPKGRDEYYNGGNIPWLRSGEVDKMNITETELFITDLGLQNSSAKWFPENTVVVAMYGATVGQVGILRCKMTTNQAICGIFPNENFFPIYLYHFLLSKKQEYLKIATGGAQANISQNIIRDTDVCLPPIEKQQEFASKIEAIEKQKELIKQSIAETEILFNSRMDYYFN